ncbi:MAG: hypothetical protein V3W14_00595 [Candidatus Neomarinimicrobiota bacterium]
MSEIRRPASFLLKNSKGHPDFVMTMLVAVILATFIVILFWMLMNTLAIKGAMGASSDSTVLRALGNFNDNARLIVLGLCSSIFSLAGAYYLRRASFDKHHEAVEKTQVEHGISLGGTAATSGFQSTEESTLLHPNYDDSEEDI